MHNQQEDLCFHYPLSSAGRYLKSVSLFSLITIQMMVGSKCNDIHHLLSPSKKKKKSRDFMKSLIFFFYERSRMSRGETYMIILLYNKSITEK